MDEENLPAEGEIEEGSILEHYKENEEIEEDVEYQENEEELELTIKFRNYVPHDEILAKRVLNQENLQNSTENLLKETVGKLIQEVNENKEIQLIPTKQNWDLKRDLMKKLKILNVQTQKAIIEIRQEQAEKEDN